MTEAKSKSKNQLEDTLDQINKNTNEVLNLLTMANNEFQKLGNMGIDESATIVKSAQNISKDFLKSSVDTANEAVKITMSCIDGTFNLLKR
jgi:hypothetical protein